jgi:hypothetical protein
MSAQTNPKLPRFVKGLIDFIYGLLIFSCVTLTLLIILSPLILKGTGSAVTASVLVGIGSDEAHRFDVQIAGAEAKGIRYAFVDEAQGTLRLETDNWLYIFISSFSKLLIVLGLTYIFHLIRAVLKDILQGDPFVAENAPRIRRIGYAILLLAFLRPAVEYIAANEIIRNLRIEPALPALVPQAQVSLPSPFKVESILTSLLFLILAQVWSYGIELKRDQALTI